MVLRQISLGLLVAAFAVIVFCKGWLPLKVSLLAAGAVALGISSWREGKDASLPAVRVVSCLLLLLLVNILAKRYETVYDLTADRIFTLAPQTTEALSKLTEPVEVIGFFKSTSSLEQRFQRFMERVEGVTPLVTWRIADPDLEIHLTKHYGIQEYGKFVLQQGERWIVIDTHNEEEFVNGLWRLLRKVEKSICWTTGQKEAGFDEAGTEGMSQLGAHLRKLGYQMEPLFLPADTTIPDRCYFVALMGPQSHFEPVALDALDAFVRGGGRALVLLDPGTTTGLESLAARWGLELPAAVIADEHSRFEGAASTVPITKDYLKHPITEALGTYTFFPLVRPLQVADKRLEGFDYQSLVMSTSQSWAETTLAQFPPLFQEREDPRGPHVLALLTTFPAHGEQRGQLLLIGDSDFVRNAHIEKAANRDLILNAAKWLARDEAYMTITPRQRRDTRLNMTPHEVQVIKLASFYGIPSLAFLCCFFIWWRRTR